METRRFHSRVLRGMLLTFFWLALGCASWNIGAQIIRAPNAETQVGFQLQIELHPEVWNALEGENPFKSPDLTGPLQQQGWQMTERDGGRILTFTKSPTPLEQLPAQGWTLEKNGGVTTAKLAALALDASNPDNALLRNIQVVVDESGPAPRYEYSAQVEVKPQENSSSGSSEYDPAAWAAAFAELNATSKDDPQIKRLEQAMQRAGPPKLWIAATLPGTISSATLNGAPSGTIQGSTVQWQVPVERAGIYTVNAASGECSWTGVWDTDYDEMTLFQSGNQVSGSYEWDGGQLSGVVSGNTLAGTWTQLHGTGTFDFTMSFDCNSFSGKLIAGPSASGDWNGTRILGGSPTAPPPAQGATITLVPPTNTVIPPINTLIPPPLPPPTTAPPTNIPSTRAPLPTSIVSNIPPQPVTPSPATLRGDCNNDGRLSEVDALCALQMSVQLLAQNLVMDVDGNGIVDSRDAVLILQRAVGQ